MCREDRSGRIGFDLSESAQDEADREQAADALTDEGCPRDTRDAHMKRSDKENVGADIGD